MGQPVGDLLKPSEVSGQCSWQLDQGCRSPCVRDGRQARFVVGDGTTPAWRTAVLTNVRSGVSGRSTATRNRWPSLSSGAEGGRPCDNPLMRRRNRAIAAVTRFDPPARFAPPARFGVAQGGGPSLCRLMRERNDWSPGERGAA